MYTCSISIPITTSSILFGMPRLLVLDLTGILYSVFMIFALFRSLNVIGFFVCFVFVAGLSVVCFFSLINPCGALS